MARMLLCGELPMTIIRLKKLQMSLLVLFDVHICKSLHLKSHSFGLESTVSLAMYCCVSPNTTVPLSSTLKGSFADL